MKILFTGEPHVGKSTLIEGVVAGFEQKQGFVTNEVTNNGQRTGFELVSSIGDRALLASVDSTSELRVSRYGVNLGSLDSFIGRLPSMIPGTLLYIDEIGQMELLSAAFKGLVTRYLAEPNPFIGTLSSVYNDEFTDGLRRRGDLEVIELTFDNRDVIQAEVAERVAKYVH